MFDIGKLAKGQFTYYLQGIADDQVDYYLGRGEADGYWFGGGAAALGLTGAITKNSADAFYAVMGGYHPATWMALSMDAKKRDYLAALSPKERRAVLEADQVAYDRHGRHGAAVYGYDFVMRPTKSVSLLHAFGSPEVRDTITTAHRASVAAVMQYLERHCAVARRGAGGAQEIASHGLICGCFEHRTSRCGDPLLHTHVVTANLLQGEDGRWGALYSKSFYRHALTAGYLYQAEMRQRLTQELGVEWTPVHKGVAEIAGVPRTVVRAFSQRREEIEAYMDAPAFRARFGRSARAYQIATRWTRRPKEAPLPEHELLEAWRERAAQLGFGEREIEQLLGRTTVREPTAAELQASKDLLAGPLGLTEKLSSFTRREVLRGWASRLPHGGSVATIERLADEFLADNERAVPLAFVPSTDPSTRRYSTPGLVAIEKWIINYALATRDSGCGLVDDTTVAQVLAGREDLTDEQREMVRRTCTSGDGVQVVVGAAGTGKTRGMSAIHQAYKTSGYQLIGASLGGHAAKNLEDSSGIPCFTISSLLAILQRGEFVLHERCVLLLDESGMVGTRQLATVFDFTRAAQAKVIVVGDDKQLPEIDAGGGLRALRTRVDVIELRENIRQRSAPAWERDATQLLRDGKIAEAMATYDEHERVTVLDDPMEVRRTLISDAWRAATQDMTTPPHFLRAMVLAAENHEVEDLNGMFRVLMDKHGYLGKHRLIVNDREFAEGDSIICLRNKYRLGVRNGTRGVIERVHRHDRTLDVLTEDGLRVHVPAWYLQSGLVDYGYAMTVHKSQSLTTSQVFFLGGPAIYKELLYTAGTRGMAAARFYLTPSDQALEELVHTPTPREPPDLLDDFVRAAMQSRAKSFAVDESQAIKLSARFMEESELRAEVARVRETLTSRPADYSAAIQHAGALYAQAVRERDSAWRILQDLKQRRQRGKRHEQHELDELIPRRQEAFTAAQARVTELHAELEGLEDQQATLDEWIVDHSEDLQRLVAYDHELDDRERRDLDRLVADQPAWLVNALGERPERPAARLAWRSMAGDLRDYRERFGIHDPEQAFGDRLPRSPEQAAVYRDLADRLQVTRTNIERMRPVEVEILEDVVGLEIER